MKAITRLATYGTLGPGRPNHHHLSMMAGTWSTGWVRGALVDKVWGAGQGFPGLILHPEGDLVEVDVLASDDLPAHWPRLDTFEGEDYSRVPVEVYTDTGSLDAFIYVLSAR